jgi:hypothetical protein
LGKSKSGVANPNWSLGRIGRKLSKNQTKTGENYQKYCLSTGRSTPKPPMLTNTGVQSINNVFHIVDKVENVGVNKYIFDLIDNVEYVVYALYSRTVEKSQHYQNSKISKNH